MQTTLPHSLQTRLTISNEPRSPRVATTMEACVAVSVRFKKAWSCEVYCTVWFKIRDMEIHHLLHLLSEKDEKECDFQVCSIYYAVLYRLLEGMTTGSRILAAESLGNHMGHTCRWSQGASMSLFFGASSTNSMKLHHRSG